jgi:predicted site-specific integrase-resolvase
MNTYSVGEFAKRIGMSVTTLQRWDREGVLLANRTPTNRRFYTDDHVKAFLGIKETTRLNVAYVRVSSQSQKPDMKNQRDVLNAYCQANGFVIDRWVEEIGGGLNFKRPKFLKLFIAVMNKEVDVLLIAHKDRLARFGFDLIEYVCSANGCTIKVLHNEELSPEQEMVQDLMTIIHCFSSRLYGLRNYKKSLKQALENDTRAQD